MLQHRPSKKAAYEGDEPAFSFIHTVHGFQFKYWQSSTLANALS